MKEERYEEILKILDKESFASVDTLSKKLFVSQPSVRRDLSEMARRGWIIRCRGGARSIGDANAEIPLDFRNAYKATEKRQLAKAAAAFVQDGQTVYLDASTTVLHILDYIQEHSNILVITNSIQASLLARRHTIRTYCTGGLLLENSLAFGGSEAEEFVRRFSIDIAFFSANGVNERGMIVDTSPLETGVRRVVLAGGAKAVFMCDHEKFGAHAPYVVSRLDEVDTVVTNGPLPKGITLRNATLIIAE